MINEYMKTKYVPGGRGPLEFDCWGLVRQARKDLFDGATLPDCASTLPGDINGLTREVGSVTKDCNLTEVKMIAGAIATAWRGKLCVHVGLVVHADGRHWILETDVKSGPCLTRPEVFAARYSNVRFYAD